MRTATTAFTLLALTVPLSCASPQTAHPVRETEPALVAQPTATIATGATTQEDPSVQSNRFAPSPLTPLAVEITGLVQAALDGRPLPPHTVRIEPFREDTKLVSLQDNEKPPARIDYVIFAMEVDIIFQPPDQPGVDDSSLRAIFFLSRTGLKVAGLRARGSRDPFPLPSWLEGVEKASWELVKAGREKALRSLLVGEAERPVVGNDALFEKLLRKIPDETQVRRAESMLSSWKGPLAFRVDDMELVGRDQTGAVWGFELDMDRKDGEWMLDSRPLVRVRRPKKQ